MSLEHLKTKVQDSGINIRPPLSIEEVREFEAQAGISLPVDYVEFITTIANGGFSPCRLSPLADWHYRYDIKRPQPEICLTQPCIITPDAVQHGDKWIDVQNVDRYEERWDNHEWDPLVGTICVAELGCGWVYSLIINGPFVGRIFAYGGGAFLPPQFVEERTFTDWIESSVDKIVDGKHLSFLDGKV
ncbi:SMI1 / KNR4 family protein [Symmachiella dynata]|uniref:SMI1 / KNR4 family protein n=1 Tax=Symmachiella dynata TaxID=2527995 RepID=A0A517ZHD8_9PLAN|nr:SMI1/KNR4 family protein [Symmachiella dynata]QDU41888.1 SMI1 / KNR4 family protein [Symmachiella dynata]